MQNITCAFHVHPPFASYACSDAFQEYVSWWAERLFRNRRFFEEQGADAHIVVAAQHIEDTYNSGFYASLGRYLHEHLGENLGKNVKVARPLKVDGVEAGYVLSHDNGRSIILVPGVEG